MTDFYDIFSNETVLASGTKTSTNTFDVHSYSKINVYVSNTGTSTNCTVTIMSSPDEAKTMEGTIQPFTLGAGGKEKVGINKDNIPEWCWAKISNADSSNSAVISVKLACDR